MVISELIIGILINTVILFQVDFDGPNIKILKLGDFGLACEVNKPLYTVCGTPTYVAPEILAESGYGLKVICHLK